MRSQAALGAYVGGLAPLLALCGRPWAALGAAVYDLGPLLWPMLAVLGRSWDICWPSWAVLGLLPPVLGRLGPKSGPNPSGSRIQEAEAL